jgi:2-isopropylmalate synthase
VYTAFSGSHQDAINKGMKHMETGDIKHWEVPYLPIDPNDLGRTYEAIIRINSQSGKGGVAYILEHNFGYTLPKKMHAELGPIVQRVADMRNEELIPEKIYDIFRKEYLELTGPFELLGFKHSPTDGVNKTIECDIRFTYQGKEYNLNDHGNGPIDACKKAIIQTGIVDFSIQSYHEHSLGAGSDAQAVSYIEINEAGVNYFGAGIDGNIEIASIRALFSALNRARK